MKEITYLVWSDIQEACGVLSKQLQQTNCKFNAIVCIQRGGCIPGVILSHLLQIPEFYSIGIKTTLSEEIKSIRLNKPNIFNIDILEKIRHKNVLIVDDVTNTGKTLQIAKEEVLRFEPLLCKTAVMIWDGDNSNSCEANYYAKYTPSWVVFPWENSEK